MNLSYNISENLKSNLFKIDKLKIQILSHPISLKNEVRLKWDTTIERIIWELSLNDNLLSKSDAAKLLSSTLSPKKRLSKEKLDAIAERNAISYIKHNWLANSHSINFSTIKKLYEISCLPTMGKMSGLTEYAEKRLDALLKYLEKGQDHPVIQAGIAQAEFISITPFYSGNTRIGRLLSYLFLYKGGYDVRDMLNLEEFYKRDVVTYKKMLELVKVQGNTTVFLEYFTFGMGQALEKAFENIKTLNFRDGLSASFWKLNERQKKIMESLENPEEKITNKEVQKVFGVSQITASRDLSKLNNLGMLLAHGKGRSVFYTSA